MRIIEKIEMYLQEAKDQYEIRKAGDGYALIGPLKPGQLYYDKAKQVDSPASDKLWDTYDQALKKLKSIGGELRPKEYVQKLYGDAHKASQKKWQEMMKKKGK